MSRSWTTKATSSRRASSAGWWPEARPGPCTGGPSRRTRGSWRASARRWSGRAGTWSATTPRPTRTATSGSCPGRSSSWRRCRGPSPASCCAACCGRVSSLRMTSSGTPAPAPPASALARGGAGRAFLSILRRDLFVTNAELPAFLAQAILQPLFMAFVFGKVLTDLGFARPGFAQLLLPGLVALTVMLTALQSTALPLVIEFSFTKEIEDRLLAPLPVSMVAVEKVLFASMRGLVAGALMFPIGRWIIGPLSLRADRAWILVGFMVLGALAGAGMGLLLGTAVAPN